jgi:hypothetical protein
VQIIGDSTMELLPDATIQTDQYLVIEPTGPNHIHVRTGGTIDESAADLYLGGERNNVFVSDTNSGVGISTKQLESVYTYWNFNTSSNTEFIADNENPILLGSIVNINGIKYIVDSVTDNQPSEGKQTVTASGYIFPTGTTTTFYYFSPNNNYNWYFGSNGYLNGPAMGGLFVTGLTNGLYDLWLGSNTNVVLSPGSESAAFVGDTSNPDNQIATIGDLENISLPSPTTQTGFRNKIINGDFKVNQRNYNSGSGLSSGAYSFDRWKSNFTLTTLTFTPAPQGQEVTINNEGVIKQVVEQTNIPAGTYVLSWTGTATGRVYNTGATPPDFAASPIVVTLDGTANVEVEFTAIDGSKTLQNVQLEQGSSVSPFEYRPITIETLLCHRYYFREKPTGGSLSFIATGQAGTTQSVQAFFSLPVPMRTSPIIEAHGDVFVGDGQMSRTGGTVSVRNGHFSTTRAAISYEHTSEDFVQYRAYNLFLGATNGYIAFSAEL